MKIMGVGSPSPNRKSENQLSEITEAVKEKVKDFDPNFDPESEFTSTEQMSWFKMVYRYMDGSDQIKFYAGFFASVLFGGSLPAFCLLFGDMIDGVGNTAADTDQFDIL